MLKVFEDFDITLVGQYQSILEAEGIATYMKNQFGTSGAGELPFIEVIPQLWVLNEADAGRAGSLIRELQQTSGPGLLQAWDCPACGKTLEAAFTQCWNCSTLRPDPAGEK